MAKFVIHEEPIYEYYRNIIEFDMDSRKSITNEKLNAALNLNIILSVACFVEGFFEDRGKLLLGYYKEIYSLIDFKEFELRKPKNVFFNNVEKFLSQKISQSTGIDNYNSIFELLLDKPFKTNPKITPYIEGINVLYQLRNVIAHGRQLHLYEVEAYYTDGIEENFNGGYKKAENYLIKKGLLSQKIKDGGTVQLYFTNEIADHFWILANDFVKAFDEFIQEHMLIGETLTKKLEEYNQKYNTDLDMSAYLRLRGMSAY